MKIFIGYDSAQPEAFVTLAHSIYTRASKPVSIHPLVLNSVRDIYTRKRGATESTEFSMTRFLVPYLCHYTDELVIFMDCDMLCKTDILQVIAEVNKTPQNAIWCVKHNYVPKSEKKMLGAIQTKYQKKNWSSFMVMNPSRCTELTPQYVNKASGLELHQFHWVREDMVGSLPLEWNWLVGEYPANEKAKILHYTLGGPWLAPYRGGDHTAEWFAEHNQL